MKGAMVLERLVIVGGVLLLAVGGPGLTAGVTTSGAAGSTAGATGSQTLWTISCPSVTACYAGGDNGTILATRDAGATWQFQSWQSEYVKSVSPIATIVCRFVDDCFAYVDTPCEALGAKQPLLHTMNGGATWHDLLPAIFVSGTYGAGQQLHTYSAWFNATHPWELAAGKLPGPVGAGGRPLAAGCRGIDTVAEYNRNGQDRIVAGLIKTPGREDRAGRTTIGVMGKLRLDVVSRCSSFSVRVDGVEPLKG